MPLSDIDNLNRAIDTGLSTINTSCLKEVKYALKEVSSLQEEPFIADKFKAIGHFTPKGKPAGKEVIYTVNVSFSVQDNSYPRTQKDFKEFNASVGRLLKKSAGSQAVPYVDCRNGLIIYSFKFSPVVAR